MQDSSSSPSPALESTPNEKTDSDTQNGVNRGLFQPESRIQWHQPSDHPRLAEAENNNGGTWHDKRWFKFHLRGFDDEEETDWWFAGTAVPLIAATLAPLANVLSLAALVTYWREELDDGNGGRLPELAGRPFKDPRWCYDLNVVSLVCGFVGNIFLLFNFTGRIRYIVALPATIGIWYVASGILIGITAGMHIYAPPVGPLQTYTQGFWHAVIAAILYFICNNLLALNMLGYFLGHYPQRFNLTDHQRTLILQTMLFFVWLAGGAAVFSHVESTGANASQALQWGFVDGLYFCDVTILTIGFGDLYPTDNLGRGLVFPYSVGGIIFLGLAISSLHSFAAEIGEDNIIRKHLSKERSRTFDRVVTESTDLEREQELMSRHTRRELKKMHISDPYNLRRGDRRASIYAPPPKRRQSSMSSRTHKKNWFTKRITARGDLHHIVHHHKSKLVLMTEERDRFNAMRHIQAQTASFKRWWALSMSVFSFAVLWCIGAVVFWRAEQSEQGVSYFQALYFCYVSLLTIGYGDIAPKSNAGRAFFVVWSLIAVPTMTILISDMSDTVVEPFKRGTFKLADFTVLPKAGAWRDWLEDHPRILHWLEKRKEARERRRRLRRGMSVAGPGDAGADLEPPGDEQAPDITALAAEAEQDETTTKNLTYDKLARRLATAIRNVAADLRSDSDRHYSYEEWVELTRLIRFTTEPIEEARREEEEEGLVEWDWIGEDSPMMSGITEPEFVLERLCESLGRYVRKNERARQKRERAASRAAGKPVVKEVVKKTPAEEAREEEDAIRRQERRDTEALDLPDDGGESDGDGLRRLDRKWTLPWRENSEPPPDRPPSKAKNAADDDDVQRDDFAERHVGPLDEEDSSSDSGSIQHWRSAPM